MKVNTKFKLNIDGFFSRLNNVVRIGFIDIDDIYNDTIYFNYGSLFHIVETIINLSDLTVETVYVHKTEEVE